jgi:hypothetical protein
MLLAASGEQMAVLSDEGGMTLYNLLGRYTKGDVTDDALLCKCKTVNSHTVDRISRPPVLLEQPCVSLLLLVQPDLIRKAFGNERLMVGGFLARCLSADSRMKVQMEEESEYMANSDIMMGWNEHIKALLKTMPLTESEPVMLN